MTFDELVEEYRDLNNEQLADEFTHVNAYVELIWDNIDNETSDRWEILSQMIHERFIVEYGTKIIHIYKNLT